eukprot:COSAG04_NODE_14162_length_578_cov_1.083507_1_plen_95_part_10
MLLSLRASAACSAERLHKLRSCGFSAGFWLHDSEKSSRKLEDSIAKDDGSHSQPLSPAQPAAHKELSCASAVFSAQLSVAECGGNVQSHHHRSES